MKRRRHASEYIALMVGTVMLGLALPAAPGVVVTARAESLEVAPTSVARGGKVIASFSLTPKENEGGWLGLYKKGAPDDKYIAYRKCGTGIERWEIVLDEPGEYQLRLFKDYYQQKKGSVAGFAVVAQHGSVVMPDKTVYRFKERIAVRYTLAPPDDKDTSGWVGLFVRGTASDKHVAYKRTGGKSGTWEIPDIAPGSYELRLFQDYYGQRQIATSPPIEVVRPQASSISFEPASVAAAGKVVVNYTILPPDDQDGAGWIGLYRRGEGNDRQITYKKTGGKSGTWEIANLPPGSYELRLFQDYFGQKLVAVSAPLDIAAGAAPAAR
jgi:uncharacterized protein (DUF2141 family)